jgi:hypothetical protein
MGRPSCFIGARRADKEIMRRNGVAVHYEDVRQRAQRQIPDTDGLVSTQLRSLLSPASDALARLERALAKRRYESLAGEFRDEIQADRFAARSAVASLFREDSLVPPAPRTWRGQLGHLLIRCQSRLMWWTLRSFKMRDEAIESVWLSLDSHIREQRGLDTKMRNQLLELEMRVRELEVGSRQ